MGHTEKLYRVSAYHLGTYHKDLVTACDSIDAASRFLDRFPHSVVSKISVKCGKGKSQNYREVFRFDYAHELSKPANATS